MPILFDALFSSVAFGHLIVDVLNSQRAVLLTFLSGPLGLTNTALALFSTLYLMAGSISQPIFGYFADHLGPRWILTGGILWMSVFFTLALHLADLWGLAPIFHLTGGIALLGATMALMLHNSEPRFQAGSPSRINSRARKSGNSYCCASS